MDKKERIITEKEAFEKMARICSQKECAPFDIVRKLQRFGLSEKVVEKVIERLKKEKYLDEKRYVRSYVHDKLRFNQWGKRKIALSLQQKQLPAELVDEVIADSMDEHSYGESLQSILLKKWKSVKGQSDYEKRGKLIRYALGRGFSMEEVLAAIAKMHANGITDETGFETTGLVSQEAK